MKSFRKSGNTLTAVTATGAGSTVNMGPRPCRDVRYLIKATSVTTGATVKIECSQDGVTWYVYGSSITVNATGNTSAVHTAASVTVFQYWRANITARTDGAYTIDLESTVDDR